MKPSTILSDRERAVLTEMAAAPQLPGTIVRDFEMLLDFIGTEGVPVSPKSSEFAIAKLPEINARLIEPANVGLSRGRQVSFPHVDALHWLLRYSQMGRIARDKATPRMVVDAPMRQRWQGLNPTERNFALLQAWWNFADEDRESPGFGSGMRADYRARLLERLRPKRNSEKCATEDYEVYLRLIGTKQIALLQMFGMIEIDQEKLVHGAGWKIERMFATSWGVAACASYRRAFGETAEDFLKELIAGQGQSVVSNEEEYYPPFYRWAAEINPLFPAWKTGINEPDEVVPQRGTITFKVSLNKDLWRRIVMPSDYTFADLAMTILKAFKFDDDHLYQFFYKDEYGIKRALDDHRCDEPMEEFADVVKLGLARLGPKQKIDFRYDFGDDWRFEVLVEGIDELSELRKPKILEKAGKAPKQYDWH